MNNSVVVKFKGASKRLAMIGPVLIVLFSVLGLFSGTYPDFGHQRFTSHDEKLDVLAFPTKYLPSFEKPHILIYRQRPGEPSGQQLKAGNDALGNWLRANTNERNKIVDDIIASGILTGKPVENATEKLGQPHFTEPTIVSPHTYIYVINDEWDELQLATDKKGTVTSVELVISDSWPPIN